MAVLRIVFLVLTVIALYYVYHWFGLTILLWILLPLAGFLVIAFIGFLFPPVLLVSLLVGIGVIVYLWIHFGWKVAVAYMVCSALMSYTINPKG